MNTGDTFRTPRYNYDWVTGESIVSLRNKGDFIDFYNNGETVGEDSSTVDFTNKTKVQDDLYIANRGYGITDSSYEHLGKGHYSEILIFDKALSDQEMVSVNYYLSNKWNLTSTVDSDGDGLMDAEDSEPTVKNCVNNNFMAFSEISSPSNTSNVGNLSCAANSGISSQ